MKSPLDSIAFFKSIRPTLDAMNDADVGVVIKALFALDDGEDVDLSGASDMVRAVFPLIEESTDRLRKKRVSRMRVPANGPQISANDPQTSANDTQTPANDTQDYEDEPQTDSKPSRHSHSHSQSHNQDHGHGQSHDHSHVDGQSARPTADEVKDWAEAEGLLIDAERFVAYYDDRDWKTGTDPIKDWKKVARKWAQTEHRKPPEKPPDRKPGKYTLWMESQDYGDLISGRAKA